MYNQLAEKANEVDQVDDVNPTLQVSTDDQIKIDRKRKILNLRNFQSIHRACEDALINKKFVAIAGDPGLGKTTAFNYFEKEHENVFVVTVTASMNVKDFWKEVLNTIHNRRIEIYEHYCTLWESRVDADNTDNTNLFDKVIKLKRIIENSQVQVINAQNTNNIHFIVKQVIKNINSTGGLLCFDECGKVKTTRFLEMIHELRDATMEHAGLIIAGPQYFKRQLQTWVNKNVNGIPELWSRIEYWKSLDAPGRDDIKEFCRAYKINDPEVIKEFQTISNYRLLYNRVIHYLEEQAEEASYLKSQTNK